MIHDGVTAVQLRDARSGKPIGSPLEHPAQIVSVAFSPNGKTVVTAANRPDNTVRLWDAATGKPVGEPIRSQGTMDVLFSPAGTTILALASFGQARFWDTVTGKPVGKPLTHQGRVACAGVHFRRQDPAHRQRRSNRAGLWSTARAELLGPPLLHQGGVTAVAMSPDSTLALTGCADGTARLWDVATAMPLGPPFRHRAAIIHAEFGRDGRSILVLDRQNASSRLWRLTPDLPDDPVRIAAWIEGLTGAELDKQGSVRVLDASAWGSRRQSLSKLGGPPGLDPAEIDRRVNSLLK